MILAKKKNMTQVFDGNKVIPITVLDYSTSRVIKGNKKSGNFVGIGIKKHSNKAEIGKYGENNVPTDSRYVKKEDASEELDVINEGEILTLRSYSKGRGFAGVMRMWNFRGGKRTHGQSDRERHPGSIGSRIIPGRVFKGKRMGRRKGNEAVTLRGIKVMNVDLENKLISVKGSVPGGYDSIVEIIKK